MTTHDFAHHLVIERVDDGHALAVLEPNGDARVGTEALVLLAQRLSRVAVESAIASEGDVHCEAAQSQLTHVAAPNGRVSAAALLDRRLMHHVRDDLRRSGTAHARVNVALVNDAGDALALGAFEFDLARR